MTAVQLISRADAIYEVCAFSGPADDSLSWVVRKKDGGGTLTLVVRGNRAFCLRDVEQ